MLDARPWEGLPPEVAQVLRPELDTLADEIVGAILEGVPDYSRPMRGEFGRGIRLGVDRALRRFVDLIEDPGASAGDSREVVRALGRGEHRAGRSLDALQAAYRIGARVAWRRVAAAGADARVEPATLSLLAEAIFAYIDELAAESVEGYAEAQAARAGERERRRRALARLLVADPPDPAAAEAAADAAGWPLPEALAATAVAGDEPDRLARRLGDEALVTATDPAEGAAVVLHAPRAAAAVRAAAGEAELATAPALPWPQAGRGARWAARTLALGRAGVLGAPAPWAAEEHLATLATARDDGALDALADRRLAPLAELRPATRARLEATLLAWLRAHGHRPSVAQALGVHPQTVRYRMNQLRDLLGPALEDPDARFELELVLRARAAHPER